MANRRIVLRRATASAWSSQNPILKNGEPGYDTTNDALKVGNGSQHWNDLPWLKDQTQILQGSTVPATNLGEVGDWYFRTGVWDVYEKTGASTWTLRGNIIGEEGPVGPQGPPGQDGHSAYWLSGEGAPDGVMDGIEGDWYIRLSNYDIYQKTGIHTWTARGNIKGPSGSPGGGGGAVGYSPMDFGAVGDNTANDGNAVRSAYAAARSPLGPNTVVIDRAFRVAGEVVQGGGVIVQGMGAKQTLVTGTETRCGLYAYDSTFRYRYGSWADLDGSGPYDSEDDNPGGLFNLTIDGRNTGGVTNGLFIEQCVDGYVENCRIVNSGGDGILVDGAQNSMIIGGYNGGHLGKGLNYSRIGNSGQGAANNRVWGMYLGSCNDLLVYSSSDPANFPPHDNYIDCLMETYIDGTDLVHLTAGDFHMTNPVITNSNGVPTGNNCLILIENTSKPTWGTVLTMHSPILNGGGGGGVTDLIRIKNGGLSGQVPNTVVIDGHFQFGNATNVFCVDGGGLVASARIQDRSKHTAVSGNPNLYRVAGDGVLLYTRNEVNIPQRLLMPDDATGLLNHPLGIARIGDTYDRRSWSRDGGDYWRDPTTGSVLASAIWDGTLSAMALGGRWRFVNAFGLRTGATFISSPGTAVALSAATTAYPAMSLVFQTVGASATVTMTDGNAGSQFQVLLDARSFGVTGNSVTWPSNMITTAQPINSQIVIVTFAKYGTDWIEVSRSGGSGGGGADDQIAAEVPFDHTGLTLLTATNVQDALEQADAALALGGGGGGGYGQELGYDEVTSNFTTTTTSAGNGLGWITGLSITVTGTGRPVDIEFQGLVTHSVANSVVTAALIQDGVNTAFYGGQSSPSTSLAKTLYMKRRLAGWAVGVDKQFQIGLSGSVAGTTTLLTTAGTSPAYLMATGR